MKTTEEKELAEMYAEFSDEDRRLAEGDGQLSRLLNTLTEELQRQLGSELWLLLLYGSYARGEAQPDSDVDLFVVLRRASEAAQEKVRQVAYEVMWEADFAYVFSLYLADMCPVAGIVNRLKVAAER